MRVGVIGAGIAGLATTKTLRSVGHAVVTFDRVPDVGGVWSSTRRYPGLHTQNTRRTYGFSDYAPPRSWPEYPPAEQWQGYLRGYADKFGLASSLRLGVAVELAKPTASGWDLTLAIGDHVEVDHVVIANGVFSEPRIPPWDGRDAHATAGGIVKAPSQHLSLDDARGRHVVVVGYGKSACDVAVSLSAVAASVTIVARRLFFKGTKKILGKENEDLAMTRASEFAFAHPRLAGPVFALLRRETIRLQALEELGLIPPGPYQHIAQSGVCMETDGFQHCVRTGAIKVRRDTSVQSLHGDDGPRAELDDGSLIPADLVVAATGFVQAVPFLDAAVRVQNDDGEFELFRRILPHDAPHLTFCGYNTSMISAINAEVGAVWTAAYLAGALDLPSLEQRQAEVRTDLERMSAQTRGRHAHGTSVVPFSIANIDAMIRDLGTPLAQATKAAQWVRRVRPEDYADLLTAVLKSIA